MARSKKVIMEKQTILVTGGAGYIGSWVVKGLLEKEHIVRVSVRDKSKTEKYQHLFDIEKQTKGKLELWEANLTKDGSFDEATNGCDAIIHMASPFILDHKNAQENLINPALNGTKNVLNAANKSNTVKRIVLTSSVAAVLGDNIDMQEQGLSEFNEDIWNTTSSVEHQPYSYSKVLAEKEAWKIEETQDKWKLVVINPSFVMGPALTKTSNSGSISFMNDVLAGKFKTGAPDLQFAFVDVRDVANAHILALENKNTNGRHILVERVMNVLDMSKIIESSFPKKYKLPKMKAPKFLVMLLAPVFGITREFVKRNVGYSIKFNNKKSLNKLGLTYTPIEKTIKDMVDWMG